MKINIHNKINSENKLPTAMLEYLVIHNDYVSAVYRESIADLKYQLQQFNLEKCFIQKILEISCQYLY